MDRELNMGERIEAFFAKVQEIGGLAMMLETKLRILADRKKPTRGSAMARDVNVTERVVIDFYKVLGDLSEEEVGVLTQARIFRNKLFHAEYQKALELLERYRGKPYPPTRWLVGSVLDGPDGHSPIKVTEAKGARDTIMGRAFHFMDVRALDDAAELEERVHAIISKLFRLDAPKDSPVGGF